MTPNPEIQFTAEQRAAIEAPFDRFTITASAGAGKTSVLTARYIRHVTQEGLTPDQILTITFTRKAAAEMKRRIVGQLIAAGRREDAQIAESGPIQTIQSFCGRLLRENAIEAAVDPRFDELSERTRTQLMRDALRLVISQDFSDSPDVEDFIRKTAGNRTGYNRADSPYSQLESAIENVVSKLRAVADPYDDFSLLATLYGPFAGLSLDSVVLLATDPPVVESLADFIPPNEQDVIRLARFLTWFEPLRAYADRLSAWEVIAELFAKTQYLEVLAGHPEGDRQIANARKLLMMASQEPLIGPLEYAELIRETQILGHREGDAPYGAEQNLVTLSTIHSSKGLEYPVVVLAETNAKIDRKPGNVLIDPGSALVATNFNRYEDARFRHLNSIRSERGREEEQRVLYVALTRAKRRLCVVLFPPSKSLTLSGIIQGNEKLERLPGIRIRGAWSESPSQSDPSQVD